VSPIRGASCSGPEDVALFFSFCRSLSFHRCGIIPSSPSAASLSSPSSSLGYTNGSWPLQCILVDSRASSRPSHSPSFRLSSLTRASSIAARCRTVLAEYNMSCDDVSYSFMERLKDDHFVFLMLRPSLRRRGSLFSSLGRTSSDL